MYILSVAVKYTMLDIVMLSVVTSPTVLAFASLVSATTSSVAFIMKSINTPLKSSVSDATIWSVTYGRQLLS